MLVLYLYIVQTSSFSRRRPWVDIEIDFERASRQTLWIGVMPVPIHERIAHLSGLTLLESIKSLLRLFIVDLDVRSRISARDEEVTTICIW